MTTTETIFPATCLITYNQIHIQKLRKKLTLPVVIYSSTTTESRRLTKRKLAWLGLHLMTKVSTGETVTSWHVRQSSALPLRSLLWRGSEDGPLTCAFDAKTRLGTRRGTCSQINCALKHAIFSCITA